MSQGEVITFHVSWGPLGLHVLTTLPREQHTHLYACCSWPVVLGQGHLCHRVFGEWTEERLNEQMNEGTWSPHSTLALLCP